MATKKKRVVQEEMQADDDAIEDSEGDSSDMDDDDDSSTGQINEEIQVEFEARMMEDSDFHGTRALLQQLFLKAKVDLSEMTNTILSQNYIGSVIKQTDVPDDDEDDDMGEEDPVLGLITVVNITEKQSLDCVQQLKDLLIDRCKACSQQTVERFSQILADPDQHVGFLVSERYINIPPQISVPMFESLFKEIDKCIRKNMKFKFGHFVLISKCYRPKGTDQMFYTNAEEEIIAKECEFSFSYSVESERDTVVEGKWDAEDQMEALRTVFVIPSENLQTAVANIKAALSAS